MNLPGWLPGTSFQRAARKCYKITSIMQTRPFNRVKKDMENTVILLVSAGFNICYFRPQAPANLNHR